MTGGQDHDGQPSSTADAEPERSAASPEASFGATFEGSDAGGAESADGAPASVSADAVPEAPVGFAEEARAVPTEPAASPDVLDQIASGIADLQSRFSRRLQFDEVKDRQLERLHAELEAHRKDQILAMTDPLVRGVLRVRDDAQIQLRRFAADPSTAEAKVIKVLRNTIEDLDLLLEDYGLGRYEELGDRFDPARQQARHFEPAPSPELVGTIIERIAPGFERAGKLIRKEQVAVYRADRTVSQDAGEDKG